MKTRAKVIKKFIYAKKPSHDSFFRYDKNRENLIISSSKIHQQVQEPLRFLRKCKHLF